MGCLYVGRLCCFSYNFTFYNIFYIMNKRIKLMKNKELTLFEKTTLYNTKLGYKNWKERVEATIINLGEEYLDGEFEKHYIPKTLEQCNPDQLDILNQNKDDQIEDELTDLLLKNIKKESK